MDTIIRFQPIAPPASPTVAVENTPPRNAESAFKSVLDGFGQELERGQRLMARASHGAVGMAPEQLLALQAGVYRYTEVVDLTSKLVDRTCTGLKTTLQSQ